MVKNAWKHFLAMFVLILWCALTHFIGILYPALGLIVLFELYQFIMAYRPLKNNNINFINDNALKGIRIFFLIFRKYWSVKWIDTIADIAAGVLGMAAAISLLAVFCTLLGH